MDAQRTRPPISAVLFVMESGHVETYIRADIQAAPNVFAAIMADHIAAGRRPLVMRAALSTATSQKDAG